jgi:small subunit ribosomal protein S2
MNNLKMSTRLPTAIMSFNTRSDFLAFQEAQTVNIPIFALADSNLNTSNILYPLPGNDDAVSSITFCSFVVSKSILLGRLSGISKYSKVKKMLNYN